MINGPGNVWIERAGRLAAYEAPNLNEAALLRAAIHIARPLGLDPASSPILDARLDDGSRVAICVPPASPQVAITVRRFGKRSFSPDDLVKLGSLPEAVKNEAERMLRSRRNILVSGGTGSGKTTLLNALASLITSAQLDPIMAQVERVIDGDTIRVRHQGKTFTVRLIREGYAHAYRLFPFSKRQEFIQLEEQARRRGIGLWNRR